MEAPGHHGNGKTDSFTILSVVNDNLPVVYMIFN